MKLGIDLSGVEAQEASKYTLHEAGEYEATIVYAEIKETVAKNGHLLALDLKTEKGLICERLNIDNPNPEAVRIGLSRLKLIATLTGHKNPNFIDDTDELLQGQIRIVVEQKTEDKGDGKTRTSNNIKAVLKSEKKDGQTTPFSTPSDKAAPVSDSAPASNLPWKPKK